MSSINLKSILVNKKKKGFSRESKKVQIGLKTYSEGRSRGKLLWDVPWEFGKSKKGFESTSIRDNFDTEVEDGTLNTKVVNVI